MKRYKYILIDIGNVVFYDWLIDINFLYNVYEAYSHYITQQQFFLTMKEELGKKNKRWIYELAEKLDPQQAQVFLEEAWSKTLKKWDELMMLMPGVVESLERLNKETKLVVVANQPIETKGTITKYELNKYFQSIYLDCEMDDSKPSHGFYQKILEDLCCNPEEMVMVGDRMDNDIIPAKEMGLATVLIEPKPPYILDSVISKVWQKQYYDIHEKMYNNMQKERENVADYIYSSLEMFSRQYCSREV